MKFGRISILTLIWGCFALLSFAQPSRVRTASSGMIRQDEPLHSRQRAREFRIQPNGAGCLSLEFAFYGPAANLPFLYLYDENQTISQPILILTGSQDTLIRLETNKIRLEVKSPGGKGPAWAMIWKSQKSGDCGSLQNRGQDCVFAQPICGPFYEEPFVYFGSGKTHEFAPDGSWGEHHAAWYEFEMMDSGLVEFSIVPENVRQDFDWVLFRETDGKSPCDLLDSGKAVPAAQNLALTGGRFGATGMGTEGAGHFQGPLGEPFCAPVSGREGERFWLLVDAPEGYVEGFHIRFGERILPCVQPQRDVVYAVQKPQWRLPNQYKNFMQRTKLLRVNLNDPANSGLAELKAGETGQMTGGAKWSGHLQELDLQPANLSEMLIQGLKRGVLSGWNPREPEKPVYFGDLLDAVESLYGEEGKNPHPADFWTPLTRETELIIREYFETTGSRAHKEVVWVRLVWRSETGKGVNLVAFRYQESVEFLRGLLSESGLSAAEILETGACKSRVVGGSGRDSMGKQERVYEDYFFPEEE